MSASRPPEPWPFFESDQDAWPELPAGASETEQLLYGAQLEVRKKRTDQEIARAAAELDADIALKQAFYQGVFDVAKGSIDRARASADFVQKAAGAIGTVYVAILGVSFSVDNRPLPLRGVLAAVFLGVAIVCSTYFLAWLETAEQKRQDEIKDDAPRGTPLPDRLARLYVRWNRHAAVDRRRWLRASVVALAASIVLLPAAFIPIGRPSAPNPITWPRPSDTAPSTNIELRKILYQAQVDKVATAEKPSIQGRFDWIWWVIAGVLAIMTVVFAQFPRESRSPSSQPA